MKYIDKVKEIVENAYIYIPYDREALLINYYDHDTQMIYATSEESGDEIQVEYLEVDLEKDMFYQLKLLDVNIDDLE
jgi:hypothetical protein